MPETKAQKKARQWAEWEQVEDAKKKKKMLEGKCDENMDDADHLLLIKEY